MRILERPYQVPEGKQDVPFCYVFDATAIADAQAQVQNNSVQLQGDSEFVLRHIAGVNLCVNTPANGGRFNYRNASGSYANGNPSSGIFMPQNWPVLPEKLYPMSNGAIFFDLYNTLRDFNICSETPIYNSYIAFFGVKRFAYQAGQPSQKTPYKYRPCKYTYEFDLTVNWNHFSGGTIVAPPRRFTVDMDRYDFELMRISIAKTTVGARGTGGLLTNDFQVMLYDSNLHQYSSLPLNQYFLNAGRPTPATAPAYQPALAPTLIYPVGSAITFDITSMLCNAIDPPQTYNIVFEGIWRIPCA